MRRGRVLIVDDNRDSADTLAALLEAWCHEVRTLYDGPSAIAATAEFQPNVVLLRHRPAEASRTPRPPRAASRAEIGVRVVRYSQLIIHGMPKRSTSIPKRCAQNVFSSGMRIVPFSASA